MIGREEALSVCGMSSGAVGLLFIVLNYLTEGYIVAAPLQVEAEGGIPPLLWVGLCFFALALVFVVPLMLGEKDGLAQVKSPWVDDTTKREIIVMLAFILPVVSWGLYVMWLNSPYG